MKLRQHRTIWMCGLRSKIFRQSAQIIGVHTDVWMPIFGQSDGIIFKQGVHRELCGVALRISTGKEHYYERQILHRGVLPNLG